ncbi:MAG TPA: NAD(P)/FAD-dependent oxidoreductase, partial [Myxococcota bacterium]|nr:NAD(P)/FAD-dependent oxidoreductase [Myxococcota bacterium]
MSSARLHRIAIIGGGFAGLSVARRLRGAPAEITLIDKQNYHLFQPLLYQVASGSLAPEHITVPMRRALRGHTHARFVLGDVEDFDLSRRRIILRDGLVEFDSLVLAAGMSPSYFGNDAWRAHTIPLKSLPDAMDIRHAVLEALEHAERAHDPAQVRAYLTFVIVGGGPTGVELAGSLTELLHDIGRDNFSQIDPASATILLIEGGERVLAPFGEPLGVRAMADLRALRVQVRVGSRVKEVGEGFVTVQMGGEQIVRVPTHTVLWAAGMQAPAVGRALARVTAAVQDPSGRIVVQPDLSVPNHRNIFVVGDLANCVQKGKALPGIAPVAMQQGDYVGQLLAA